MYTYGFSYACYRRQTKKGLEKKERSVFVLRGYDFADSTDF